MDNQSQVLEEGLLFDGNTPMKELDEPLNFNCDGCKQPDSLKAKTLELEEKNKERQEKRYFSAFRLIVGCLVFLGIIYIVEVIASAALKQDLTNVTDGIIEIIKTLLFTLSGYLFGRKESGH